MLILIDHANVDAIAQTLTYLPIDGVTTNPTILFREGKEPLEVLHQIKGILPDGAQLHVQIVSERADDMVAEARALRGEIGGNLFIKLPVTREGFAAIPRIVREGMQVTATGIHSSMQGFMAAKAGARYVAPYVNRMDNYGIDGVRVASEIHRTLRTYDLKTCWPPPSRTPSRCSSWSAKESAPSPPPLTFWPPSSRTRPPTPPSRIRTATSRTSSASSARGSTSSRRSDGARAEATPGPCPRARAGPPGGPGLPLPCVPGPVRCPPGGAGLLSVAGLPGRPLPCVPRAALSRAGGA